MRGVLVLLGAVLLIVVPFASATASANLRFSSLKDAAMTFEVVFRGEETKFWRDGADENKDKTVSSAEAQKFNEETGNSTDKNDDTDLTLDGKPYKSTSQKTSIHGLEGSTQSTAPVTWRFEGTARLEGEPDAGDSHKLKLKAGASGASEGNTTVTTPPGYEVLSVSNGTKQNDCTVFIGEGTRGNTIILIQAAVGKCGSAGTGGGSGIPGFEPAAVPGAALGAALLVRRIRK